jgi:hypothetical protein
VLKREEFSVNLRKKLRSKKITKKRLNKELDSAISKLKENV